MRTQSKENIVIKFEDYEEVSEFDSRVENILPIVRALDFLQKEARQSGDKKLYDLISSSFKMVVIAYDVAFHEEG